MALSIEALAVNRTKSVPGCSRRTRSSSSRPERPGMVRSETTRSAGSRASASSAASALSQHSTRACAFQGLARQLAGEAVVVDDDDPVRASRAAGHLRLFTPSTMNRRSELPP